MTNYDKIRNMTLEELAVFLDGFYDSCDPDKCECFENDCKKCIRAWLRKEKDEMNFEDAIRISNAIEKMEEETMHETKQKTMMEDFFEKFPDAPRNSDGLPLPCPSKMYDVIGMCSYDKHANCVACWSRPSPPQFECYKNATVIVEYDKNGEPNISWVRQEDTERIGYEGAMKRVMKVKANENE